MARLSIALLGPLQVTLDGEPVSGFASDKVRALLAYLAVEGEHAHRRQSLAGLLWADWPERSARDNLRHALSNLRAAIGDRAAEPPTLGVTRETIRFNPEGDHQLDVATFESLAAGDSDEGWAEAVDLYRGPFLEGFSLADSAPFEEWAGVERQRLERQAVDLLGRLAWHWEGEGDLERALGYARRRIELAPWDEEGHRQVMRLLALCGQRGAALAQYEACRRALDAELGVEPAAETVQLYERVRAGELVAVSAEPEGGLATVGALAPPVLPPALPSHNLPAQVTSFIGRERELAELGTLVADPGVRLMTVVGPGGMGKTRLALQTARAALDRFPAGAWWVELAPVPDDTSVPRAVAATLGVQEQSDRPLPETIADSLQTRDLLLVLDNCEHVVDGVSELVSLLLTRCPDLSLLATSREALHVPGEHLYEAPPLALPAPEESHDRLVVADAVRLFGDRAAAIHRGFALDEKSTPLVVGLCRRLDGMPLAIELAAARMRALSLQEITRRLDDRFRLLTGGSRTALPRQQTLRNAIEWSYELLDEAERTLFDRLSVFTGSFSVEGAEQVCSGGRVLAEDVLDLVASLVDKSLLTTAETEEGTRRYRLLETLRAYGRERLEWRGEGEEMARRHAWFCVELAEAVEPALYTWDREMVPAIRRLDADANNLDTAMRWSLASGESEVALRIGGAVNYWLLNRPRRRQYVEWLQRAVAKAGAIAPRYRAKALSTIAFWALDHDDCYAAAQEALALAYETGDLRLIGWTLYATGVVCAGKQPRASLEEALDIARTEGDRALFVSASVVLAMLYAKTPTERKALLEELLPKAPRYLRMWISAMAGRAALALGNLEEAKTWSEATHSGWTDLGNKVRLAAEPLFVARVAALQGDYDRARELASQAADLAHRGGEMTTVPGAALLMGKLAWMCGDHGEASRRLSESLDMARAQARLGAAARAQVRLALVACEQGAYDRAEALCGEAQGSLPEGDQSGTRLALSALARIALCRGEAARAVELYRKCLDGPMRWQHRPVGAEAAEHLAWALAADGQAEEAARLLACAAHEREDMGIVLSPVDRPYHERALEAVRQALDDAVFATAWAAGEAMGLEQALEWASWCGSDGAGLRRTEEAGT